VGVCACYIVVLASRMGFSSVVSAASHAASGCAGLCIQVWKGLQQAHISSTISTLHYNATTYNKYYLLQVVRQELPAAFANQ
jgi:hypothetical protein